MKSNKNRIIMSLLVLGMLFSLVTANTLSANENEDIEEIDVETPVDESTNNNIKNTAVSTMSDTITPYAITDSVFSDSSRPLEQAIISNYDGTNGTVKIDTDNDGYISANEANAYSGAIILNSKNITGTMDGIENFLNINNLSLAGNDLIGEIPEGLKNMTLLRTVIINGNSELSGTLDLSGSKTTLINLQYHGTAITADLSGYSSLAYLSISNVVNPTNMNALRMFLISSPELNSMVRVYGNAGFISWDSQTNYYVLNAGAYYNVFLEKEDKSGAGVSQNITLTSNALMDSVGNLIVDATLDNIVDGKVVLPNGGTVITATATYHFEDYTEIGGVNSTTTGSIIIEKHVVDGGSVDFIGNVTKTANPNGSTITVDISNKGGTTRVPAGSIITNNDKSITYVIDDATMTNDGILTSTGILVTVPEEAVSLITINGKEDTLPAGTTVTMDGETVTYPGTIVIDTVENTVTYLPADSLFDETGTGLASGITQQDIDDALAFVNTITPGSLQDELLAKVESAQKMMDAKNKAEGLLNSSQDDLASGVDQNTITNVGNLINDLVDGSFKDALQSLVDKAQAIFDAIKSVNDLYNDDKSDLVVGATQDMIDSAQKEVDKLDPNTDRAKELQKLIDDAQTILDNREAATNAVDNLFNDKKDNLAINITQDDIKNAQDLVNKLPDGEYKDNLQKEIDIAQAMQDAKDAANDLLDKDGNLNSGVTQEDIDNAQDLVNKLPDGKLKDELQLIIDEAQKQLDEKNTSKPSTAPGTTVKPSVDSTSTTGGSNVNTGDETNMTLYMGLFALSLAGIVLVVRKRKIKE
ncbi:toxin Cry1Ac domain D-VI-related protein [Breznakia pachnodae]|uniref:LPXTG-motif cell wall-anchored protein n=1 Tax=Breznakia pachnodae TaxID=265178 RepID=A0ABU0E2P4_9FIRM|nr:toxin Cry1Ac domain D-VI-related protein [Breznakia pachnodae]MDQ0361162.1 LPXTG-motif cell wall-anchored protein [Breznakia pachnodae]